MARHAIAKVKAEAPQRRRVPAGAAAPVSRASPTLLQRRGEPAGRASPTWPSIRGSRTRPTALSARRPDLAGARQFGWHGLVIFGGSLGLFLLRFLVPSPVGLADDGDGPRIMCGLGVTPVTYGNERYDGYAYFRYALSPTACAHASVYPSSEHLLLVAARWLTPVLGLPGSVNLIALGVLASALAAVGIASLACGLASSLRARLAVAGLLWLIMADAAFFDNFASPFSEGATLIGLLLVAAGLVYLGRGRLASAAGIALAGAGGYLCILSKEQYLSLVAPVSIGLILAATARDGRRGVRRFLTGQMAAAVLVAGLLGAGTAAYAQQDATSPYTKLLHQEQVVDVIFSDIVPRRESARTAEADLRALGLPPSWQSYAGDTFWNRHSVYYSPLYERYASKLTDGNLTQYFVTHPLQAVKIAQEAAVSALQLRVTYLGSYAPSAGQPPGALEGRVGVISSIEGVIPDQLGLFWLVPLWAVMAALAIVTLRRPRRVRWHHDAAAAALGLTGCAVTAFVPAALYAGTDTTHHMAGMNMATALAFAVTVTLLGSLLRLGLAQDGKPARSWISVPGPREEARPLAHAHSATRA